MPMIQIIVLNIGFHGENAVWIVLSPAARYFYSSSTPAEGKATLCTHPVTLCPQPCPIDLPSQSMIRPVSTALSFQYRLQI